MKAKKTKTKAKPHARKTKEQREIAMCQMIREDMTELREFAKSIRKKLH